MNPKSTESVKSSPESSDELELIPFAIKDEFLIDVEYEADIVLAEAEQAEREAGGARAGLDPEHEFAHEFENELAQGADSAAGSKTVAVTDAGAGADTGAAATVDISDTLEANLKSIPHQLEFKIGHVAELVGVETYVLRFWETEFEQLHPKKSRKGQRAYTRKDIETAMMIKKLLYEDRFSIEGARARLRDLKHKVKHETRVLEIAEKEKAAIASQLSEVRSVTSVTLGELRSMLTELDAFRAELAR